MKRNGSFPFDPIFKCKKEISMVYVFLHYQQEVGPVAELLRLKQFEMKFREISKKGEETANLVFDV